MERFSFTSQVAFVPRGDLLDRVIVAPLTRPIAEGLTVQAAIFRFEPGGRLRTASRDRPADPRRPGGVRRSERGGRGSRGGDPEPGRLSSCTRGKSTS